MVRRSSLYAWQLQYGLSSDTSPGSVPTESQASVGGNTGGNAGGSNPSPPAKGGGISSLSAQSTLQQVVDAFEGIDVPTIKYQLLSIPSTVRGGSLSRSAMPSMAVKHTARNALTDAIKDYIGNINGNVELYADGNGRNWLYVSMYNTTQATNASWSSGWFRHPGSDGVLWRYVP